QRARHVVEDLALQLLAADARPLILRSELAQRGRSQVVGVVVGGASCGDAALVLEQLAQKLQRPRRRGDELLRVLAEAQPERQVGPRLEQVLPGGELVAERLVMLRPAEQVGLVGAVAGSDRSVRPGQAPLRWLV